MTHRIWDMIQGVISGYTDKLLVEVTPPEYAYLIGPDEGLDSQVILYQLLHVGLSSDQRGELRSG